MNGIILDLNSPKEKLRKEYDKQFRILMNNPNVNMLRKFVAVESFKQFYFLPDLIPLNFQFAGGKIPTMSMEKFYNTLPNDIKHINQSFGCFEIIKETKIYKNDGKDNDVMQDEKYMRAIYIYPSFDILQTKCNEMRIAKSNNDLILDFVTFIKMLL